MRLNPLQLEILKLFKNY